MAGHVVGMARCPLFIVRCSYVFEVRASLFRTPSRLSDPERVNVTDLLYPAADGDADAERQ